MWFLHVQVLRLIQHQKPEAYRQTKVHSISHPNSIAVNIQRLSNNHLIQIDLIDSMLMYFPKLLCCCRRNLTYTLRKHRGLPFNKSPALNPVHILLLSEASIRPDLNNSRRCQIYNCTCGEGAEYCCFLPE